MARLTQIKPGHPIIVGSILGDVGALAKTIVAATAFHDVAVWANSAADVFFVRAERAPEVPAEYVLGTYGMGASIADVEEDLLALRKARVSDSIIF